MESLLNDSLLVFGGLAILLAPMALALANTGPGGAGWRLFTFLCCTFAAWFFSWRGQGDAGFTPCVARAGLCYGYERSRRANLHLLGRVHAAAVALTAAARLWPKLARPQQVFRHYE